MGHIYELLLIGTAVLGLYASFMLLFVSRYNRLLNKLLAGFLLPASIYFFFSFCVHHGWAPDFIILIRTFIPTYYFLPAFCYLYFRSFIQDDGHLSKKDMIHLLPLFLHFLYISPLVYAIINGNIEWRSMISNVDKQTYFYNHGPLPDVFHVIFRMSTMLTYIFLIWKSFCSIRYREFVTKNETNFPFAIRWIKYFIIIITTHGVFSLFKKIQVFFYHGERTLFQGDTIAMCLVLSFDFLIFYIIMNPVILFGLPHFSKYFKQELQENKTSPTHHYNLKSTAGIQNEKVHEQEVTTNTIQEDLEDNQHNILQALIERMNEYIANDQPFLKPAFNIENISNALQVPQHHIAYIFKQVLKKSFVDYRNELRINYVTEAINNGRLSSHTIEAIGSESGFSSRTTFYTVFKKIAGKTPGQYVEEVSQIQKRDELV